MRPLTIVSLSLLVLAACRSEEAALPDPVTMTEDALGHYCQMNLSEHPGPKAQIHLEGVPEPIFFSQVRDAVAYLRMPEQSNRITAIYVSDMGAEGATWERPGPDNWVQADAAFYVAGSDTVGGMGAPELVPFGEEADAATFAAENGGAVLRLADIADDDVLSPVSLDDGTSGVEDEAGYRERLHALAAKSED